MLEKKIPHDRSCADDGGTNHLLRDVRGSISVFMATVIVMVCLLGSSVVSLAGLRQTEHQIAQTATLQADTVLSAYDRKLFDSYGVMAFGADVPDQIGAVIPMYKIPGTAHLEMSSAEDIKEGQSLKNQIVNFMKIRTGEVIVERIAGCQEAYTEIGGLKAGEYLTDSTLCSSLNQISGLLVMDEEKNRQRSLEEIGSVTDPEVSSPGGDDSRQNPANWSDDDHTLALQGWESLIEAGKTKLSFKGENPLDATGATLLDLTALAECVNEAERFLAFGDLPVYDDLSLNVYAQRMFKCQPTHSAGSRNEIYATNLRHVRLNELPTERNFEIEYVLFGKERDVENQMAGNSLLFGTRLLIQLVDYRADETKMAQARSMAAVLSTLIAVLSVGQVTISPTVLTDLIWIVECALAAYKEFKSLCLGMAVDLWPYRKSGNLSLYYQDYMLLYSLFVPQDQIILRIADLLEANSGLSLCMGVVVRVDWKGGPNGSLWRDVVIRAQYDRSSPEEAIVGASPVEE